MDLCGVRDMLCQVDLSQWGNNKWTKWIPSLFDPYTLST